MTADEEVVLGHQICELLDRVDERQELMRATYVNLKDAHLCCDCEAIGDAASRCPRCGSTALIAVTRALPRMPDGTIRMVCGAEAK
jgi:uncharacterized paraquat-inducible protein A